MNDKVLVERELLERIAIGANPNSTITEMEAGWKGIQELREMLTHPIAAQSAPDEREAFEAFARDACRIPAHIPVNWEAQWTQQAWEGWQAGASWQRAQSAPVVPEGYVLVPQSMYLDAASIEAMAFVMGGPEEDDGSPTYCDCVMWVGEIDDDGVKRYGIHVYNTECEEEGSTTLAEFAAAPQPAAPVAECTNEDSWNCKYCRKTETCAALKDERNFGAPPKAARQEQGDEDLRRDAERYRWLRNPDRMPHDDPFGHLIVGQAEGEDILWRDALDRQIDLDMAASAEGKA